MSSVEIGDLGITLATTRRRIVSGASSAEPAQKPFRRMQLR
jgi:hypothetical protein